MSGSWGPLLEGLKAKYPSLTAFVFQWWHYNMPLMERVRQIVPPPARIIEVGTGTGALSLLLAAHGYQVLGVDIDPQVIDMARRLAEYMHLSCPFEVGNGFDLRYDYGQYDLAFSSGVLEHFPPEDIVRLLREQARIARFVVATIPTWHALRDDPLTEPTHARVIPLGELKRSFRLAGLKVVRTFGFGTPTGALSFIYRALLPRAVQRILQNRLAYAATVGCVGRSPARRS